MAEYKHLFIDLDKTLYDFDRSSRETFLEFYNRNSLKELGINSFESFFNRYRQINLELWEVYRNGGIGKTVLKTKRFYLVLKEFGIDSMELAEKFAEYYVNESPLKQTLFEGVRDTLDYLHPAYNLHVITNGFSEVQFKKIKANNLINYFQHIITSEDAGGKKPDSIIFEYALKKTGATLRQSLMIGDDQEVDIEGAKNCGMDQVFVNYNDEPLQVIPTYTIKKFSELKNIL